MKKILFDLTNRCSWGDKCYTLGCMSWYHSQGWKLYILTDNWNNQGKDYLYNENIEPIDFFTNIIVPTFDCCFYDIPSNIKIGNWDEKIFFDKKEKLMANKNSFINYFRPPKEFHQIDFKLSESMKTDLYLKYKEELSKTTNWLIFSTYDSQGKYEKLKDRRFGLGMSNKQFKVQKDIIMHIDNICKKDPTNRIILISKKANDWDKILTSNFLDMRNFEKLGLSFSQSFDLVVNESCYIIGSRSSYQLWTNFSKRGIKITFADKNRVPSQIHDKIFLNPTNLEHVLKNID